MGRSQRREGRKEPMRNPGIQEDLQAETKLQGTGLFPGFMASFRGLRLEVVTGNSKRWLPLRR